MKTDFAGSFADFLALRMENAVNWLNENHAEYRKHRKEQAAITTQKHDDVNDYEKAMRRLCEVNESIRAIENSYMFLSGLQELKNISDAVTSQDFMKKFIG